MSPTKSEIDQVLLDVRKAYRLLHDYQRAALDAVKYVGTQLGFTYHSGCPNFSEGPPKGGRNAPNRWAWDWLGLVFYDFTFTKDAKSANGTEFAIWLFSDTGYFLSDSTTASQTKTDTFARPEASGTKMAFLFFREWAEEFDGFRHNRNEVRRFLETGGELPKLLHEAGVRGVCCDFAELADERAADGVIDRLVQFAKEHGFEVERVKKAR